jgi:hypothetical protein
MNRLIILFPSTRNAIKAERQCKATGTKHKIMSAPRDISSECGIAIEIDAEDQEIVEAILQEAKIEFTIHIRSSETKNSHS